MEFNDTDLMKTILEEIRMMREEIQALKIVSVLQESNLKTHMKRSDALEQQNEMIRAEIKPIKRHVLFVNWTLQALGVLGVLVTIIEFVMSKFH